MNQAIQAGLDPTSLTPKNVQRYVLWASEQDRRSRSSFGPRLVQLYRHRRLRSTILKLVLRLEGGRFFSTTLREILHTYHGVTIGQYSYGGCLVPGYLPFGTVVGNYSSMSSFMRVYRRNHPIDRLSTHPFFYNREVGLLETDSIQEQKDNPLVIGHDVWIGDGTVILPKCQRIGNGAVVGAGAVVTRDVPDFAVVAGNPARVLSMRFEPHVCQRVQDSAWWDMPLAEVAKYMPEMLMRLADIPPEHPLLNGTAEFKETNQRAASFSEFA